MRSGLRAVLWSMAAGITLSCAAAHEERLGGESHFLRACEESCADDFECMAGVCTRSCESDDACDSIHTAVRCPDPSGVEIQRTCELTCTTDAQCAAVAEGLICAAGVCREGAIASADADASSVAADAPLAMLLVDTSGSMERMIDCVCQTPSCEECLPDCDRGERNRFATVLEALSGTWEDFQCKALSRQPEEDTGEVEFTYDVGYALPYHQPPIDREQLGDGLLDAFRTRVRFGVATFDGWDTYVGAPPLVPLDELDQSRSGGIEGQWSYGTFSSNGDGRIRDDGRPVGGFFYPNCTSIYQMDTGIRSPDAAEGATRQAFDASDMLETNARIQSELRLARPYGGTPIASSFDDLLYYFTEDPDVAREMVDTQQDRHVILITDGYPDDDYRTYGCNCAFEGDLSDPARCGISPPNDLEDMFCPYPTATDAAAALIERGVAKVHVVGLGLDDPIVVDQAHAIASAGGTVEAHLANSSAELRDALQAILDGILAERND